jgi:hypothetical protein
MVLRFRIAHPHFRFLAALAVQAIHLFEVFPHGCGTRLQAPAALAQAELKYIRPGGTDITHAPTALLYSGRKKAWEAAGGVCRRSGVQGGHPLGQFQRTQAALAVELAEKLVRGATPFFALQSTQQETRLPWEFRPDCACGTT